ncbi:MAG: M3 family metallopeptidase [Shewanella sp.]|uniref:Peptidase M3A n=1 Tax=Shewanella cutis TaxID=2766780 RepID=A0ABS9QSL2_9GAMM|nr:M3 family metallopeptidase [Shewanella sp. PS-2]MCG9963343.1 peptidase M3A [Shewanella sp. PS-2]
MQKTILAASLFGWCLSSIIGAVYAAPSPVPLLAEQCLRQPNIDLARAYIHYANVHSLPALTLSEKALVLEQQTIGLNNINDRLNYYRGLSLSGEERQGLLQCQLRLADVLSHLIIQTEYRQLADELTHAADKNNNEHLNQDQRLLGEQLTTLLEQHQSTLDKAKLHTAQATIRQGLSRQQFQLSIQGTQCQLVRETTSNSTANIALNAVDNSADTASPAFSDTIASYLLKQPDPQCRQLLWQAYQGRTREHNQLALDRIATLRQQMANDAHFADFASYSLAKQQLYSPTLVKQFLDSQTESIQVAPWDIGRRLSQLDSAENISLNTSEMLERAFGILSEYGLSVEVVDRHIPSTESPAASQEQQQIIRIYHQQRLLGEVYLAIGNQHAKANQHTLRQSVIGQQFGQQALELNPTLFNYKDIEHFTNALANAITSLARGSHFYLNNTLGPSLDSNQLPSLWLGNVIREALFSPFAPRFLNQRERLANAYGKQLSVFRAKVALNFYQSLNQQSYSDLTVEFNKSFGENWEQPIDYPYSFKAIANEGPLYYQSLWQTQLAKFVYQSTQDCKDKLGLFNLLVVNEAALTLSEQLRASIGDPVDAASLIQRIIPVSGGQNPTQHCVFSSLTR